MVAGDERVTVEMSLWSISYKVMWSSLERTCDLWICCQTRYWLRYGSRLHSLVSFLFVHCLQLFRKQITIGTNDLIGRHGCADGTITKTRLFKFTEKFTTKKWKFSDKKKSDIFHITAQNIDCGYSLEPPRQGGSNEYPQSMFWVLVRGGSNSPRRF